MSGATVMLCGTVQGLLIQRGEEDFVQTRGDRATGGGIAAALAAAGMAGAASGALLAAAGGKDSVEFFACAVDGTRVAGRFSKVTFSNGDEVEIVGELQQDCSLAVFAVRRPSDQTLWMFPHCSRGAKKHWAYVVKAIGRMFVAWEVTYFLIFGSFELLSPNPLDPVSLRFEALGLTIMSLAISCHLSFSTGRRWRPFVAKAEAIFARLGYADPSRVDMNQENKKYWKRNGGKWPYLFTTSGPWIYRYVTDDLRSPERGDCQVANPAS